ncbi:MAG: signal peptidase II [Anaerorhabdus sp.]
MKKQNGLLFLIIVSLDLLTKHLVSQNIESFESVEVISGFFSLTYAKNTGAAWSLFSGRIGILTLISFVGIVGFCILYKMTDSKYRWEKIAITMMIAGAFGNFYDRLVLGYVRDFLDFIIFNYDFPIFNVADTSLCLGVVLLMICTLLKKEEDDGKENLDS